MGRIKFLSENLINQIAAGEVVERPASVVKELVENSLDASSSRIDVEIELGGRRLIEVADDGIGMSREDALIAFQRHATSKIATLDDLAKVSSLGFRGEALASIASVARVEMVTKIEGEVAAIKITLQGGNLVDTSEAARDTGTTIKVRDIFFNTPARRKFMRSEATENFHITNVVTHYALARPDVAFSLINNGRIILKLPRARSFKERIMQVFGSQISESLLPVDGGREMIALVKGFVSAPRERRLNRDAQYFFVNGRYVKDRVISEAVREAYRSVLPHGTHPIAVLYVEVESEEVDVNVHPAKTEVRFRRPDAVRDCVTDAIRASLAGAGISVLSRQRETASENQAEAQSRFGQVGAASAIKRLQNNQIDFTNTERAEHGLEHLENNSQEIFGKGEQIGAAAENNPPSKAKPEQNMLADSIEIAGSTEISFVEDKAIGPDVGLSKPTADNEVSIRHLENAKPGSATTIGLELTTSSPDAAIFEDSEEPSFPERPVKPEPILPPLVSVSGSLVSLDPAELTHSTIRPLQQIRESYIVAIDEKGLLLVDQHVAHERILFEQFRKGALEGALVSQNLLLPETLDLTPAQSHSLPLSIEQLEAFGFRILQLSGRTIAISAVPSGISSADARALLVETLEAAGADQKNRTPDAIRDKIAASLACRAAIKVNTPLSEEKMSWLIYHLILTSSPTTCPHGRPIILRLSIMDIEKAFERI
ncbi:MAG TPA: DNA mismatch repair endonuclease MutL [Pyrinomonadaceae bacterium]|nr:DNA mismatch repair endonuclease MutL [Pyrinomonadaceae bacterium]